MRTLQIRSLSLPALAFLVFAGNAAAQDKSPSLLNTLEVEQLVRRAEPGALNTESATTVRQLATYHQKLASGATATAPSSGAPFEAGAGAPAPTIQELNDLAVKAQTPADHRALQEYCLTLAKRYAADANAHVAMARAYRGLPRSPAGPAAAAGHCDRLVKLSQDAAKEATQAAAMHQELSGAAR